MGLLDFWNRPLIPSKPRAEKPVFPPPLTDAESAVLRDKFAACALTGLLARGLHGVNGIETVAYSIANQMIRTRKTL